MRYDASLSVFLKGWTKLVQPFLYAVTEKGENMIFIYIKANYLFVIMVRRS
jgi:hypothetical protein